MAMRRMKVSLVLAVVVGFCLSSFASADVISTITIADTEIRSSQNDTPTGWPSSVNYGTAPDLYPTTLTKQYTDVRSLFKFDLTGVESSINSATFSFFHTTEATFFAYRLTDEGWTELGATWFSKDGSTNWATAGGDYTGSPASSGVSAAQGFATIDVTDLVQAMVDASQTTGTFLVVSGTDAGARIWAKENTGYQADQRRPTLTIDSEAGTVPEPGTLLLLGTGALGALGYVRRKKMN